MQKMRLILFGILLLSFLSCDTTSMTTSLDAQPRKATNIVFIVGDGMGISQITAGMYHMNNKIALEDFPVVGLIKTHAHGNMITDSAAGATAFATGSKTSNGKISLDPDGNYLQTISEKLADKFNTGLAVTSTITHATPACYYSHNQSRKNYEEIASDLAGSTIDIAIGFGREQFTTRADGRDLVAEMTSAGYTVHESIDAATAASKAGQVDRLAVLLPGEPRGVSARPNNYLKDASLLAINYLDSRSEPFFLMIEGSQIDWAGHANQHKWMMDEMEDFDAMLRSVLAYARKDKNTIVVVTADHETGGYGINAGDVDEAIMDAGWTTGGHTAAMVPVFAYGPGAEIFSGIYDNTEIFYKLLEAIGK